mgnify:CR=1 FL=1
MIELMDISGLPLLSVIENDMKLAEADIKGENILTLSDDDRIVAGAAEALWQYWFDIVLEEYFEDLQHLYYFEKLLEEVNNDLVREAQNKGSIAIGAVCFQIPEHY